MADRPDKDELERAPPPPEPPRVVSTTSSGSLPIEKPQPLATQRAELMRQIQEIESAIQYMGAGHPKRESMRQRLEQLRMMVTRIDEEMRK